MPKIKDTREDTYTFTIFIVKERVQITVQIHKRLLDFRRKFAKRPGEKLALIVFLVLFTFTFCIFFSPGT